MELAEATQLLTDLAPDLAALRKTCENVRAGTAALDEPLAVRRLSESYRNEQRGELRQTAISRHRELQARAALVDEQLADQTPERTRGDYIRRARPVPEPTEQDFKQAGICLDSDKHLARQNAAILSELRIMNTRAALRGTPAEEIKMQAKARGASGTEADAAWLFLAKCELATRPEKKGDTATGVARVDVDKAIAALALPPQAAGLADTLAKIRVVTRAIQSAYRELQDPNFRDLSPVLETMRADPAAFRAAVPERLEREKQRVKDAARRITRAGVLEELDAQGGE